MSTRPAKPASPPLTLVQKHASDFWLARGAVVAIIVLQLFVSDKLALGSRMLAPVLETVLLVPLSIATAWTHVKVRRATREAHWVFIASLRRWVRGLALFLTAVISIANFGALVLLIRALIVGDAGPGPTLLLNAVNIWATNVIAFALWYWNMDRAGPAVRGAIEVRRCDFLFSNMTTEAQSGPDWTPGFIDYLYLSFTNSTAWSPADTLPISQRAKLLMMTEACISLLTIAIVAARAVNILH